MSDVTNTAARIVLSPWFMPGYIGLVVGIVVGSATCFIVDWYVSRPSQ